MRFSDDTGKSWTPLIFADPLSGAVVDLTSQSDTELIGVVESEPYSLQRNLLRLSLRGTTATWTRLPFPDTAILKTVFTDNGILYALGISQLYRSGDTGRTWTTVGPEQGLPRDVLPLYIVKNSLGRVFLETNSRGVYVLEDEMTGVENIAGSSPHSSRVIPNPFNASSTIEFDLAVPRALRIDLVDIRGRLLSVLAGSRAYAPGRHRIAWEPNELSDGIYFVRILGDSVHETVPVLYHQ